MGDTALQQMLNDLKHTNKVFQIVTHKLGSQKERNGEEQGEGVGGGGGVGEGNGAGEDGMLEKFYLQLPYWFGALRRLWLKT